VARVDDAAEPLVEVWLPRQMLSRRILLACSWWLAWPVPSRAKYRSAEPARTVR
jgi:hypothetical protein